METPITPTDAVAVEIEACAPEELPPPTAALRWYITDRPWHFPIVRIEGQRADVEQFVRLHWGDEFFDYDRFSPDEFFTDYAPKEA